VLPSFKGVESLPYPPPPVFLLECGRFTQRYTWSEVLEFLRVFGPPRNLQPHYNIAPTMTVDVIRLGKDGKCELVPMRWDVIPAWWPKSLKEIPATFNARAESVADKPMFRDAFKGQRCIIPASGITNGPATRATSSRIFSRRPTAPPFSPSPPLGSLARSRGRRGCPVMRDHRVRG
jgi:putative SOS response-associated peptidase YedK